MKLIVCIAIFFLCSFNGYAQEKAIIFKNVNVVDVVEGNIRKGGKRFDGYVHDARFDRCTCAYSE